MPLSPETTTLRSEIRQSRRRWRWRLSLPHWTYWFTGSCLLIVTTAVSLDFRPIHLWDRQIQTLFFELRGPIAAPDDVVIVTIDEESLSQGEHYLTNPAEHAALAPIQQWPWQRQAYAIAIEKLIEAGAKAVALDVVLASPSGYGEADDQALKAVLDRHGDRVVLAATYGSTTLGPGEVSKSTLPIPLLRDTPAHLGAIQFPIDEDGRIHRQGRDYLIQQRALNADINAVSTIEDDLTTAQSFAEATLQAAQIKAPSPRGNNIYFHGPSQTFEHIPFWYVIDPDPWQNILQSGAYFKDKIVLIGTTAQLHQDFHAAPFSESFLYPFAMPGVEILANDVATLAAGNAVVSVGQRPWQQGMIIVVLGIGIGVGLRRINRPLVRLSATAGAMFVWLVMGYLGFVMGNVFLPFGAPMIAIAVVGISNFVASLVAAQLQKQQLRRTLAQYVTSPIVQEIISQQNDFQDLLRARAEKVVGRVLGDRYLIVQLLGAGGFSETYVAQDLQRPQRPTCVVKELKIVSDNPKIYKLAQRLFVSEAETLEHLGQHDQIPRLLAYFEANHSFYLVQEMIEGELLRDELVRCKPLAQRKVVDLLQDLLPVIAFVHQQGVIHRDIKPSNIIRRHHDNRLVLIDFGAVKQISNQFTDTSAKVTSTIGIGTQGYMPSEQSSGIPNLSSDIYALGVTAIEALTGAAPKSLERDGKGEILWMHRVPHLNLHLAALLNKMVRYDFSNRYPSAQAVIDDLSQIDCNALPNQAQKTLLPLKNSTQPSNFPKHQDSEEISDTHETEPAEDSTTKILPEDWGKDYAPLDN
ncbi:MAG: serine/threonine-protein kinase [Cyanobacteria bacterium J06642_9]